MHSSRALLDTVGSDLRDLNRQMSRSRSTAVRACSQFGSTLSSTSNAILTSPSAVELLWSAPFIERRSSLGTGTSARVRSISSTAAAHAADALYTNTSNPNSNSQVPRAKTPTPTDSSSRTQLQLQTQFSSGSALQTHFSNNGSYFTSERGRHTSEQLDGSSTPQMSSLMSPPLQYPATSDSRPHSATSSSRAFPLGVPATSAAVSFTLYEMTIQYISSSLKG